MPRGNGEKLSLNQPPPPPLSTPNSSQETPPVTHPSPPPPYWVPSTPPPPQGKKAPQKTENTNPPVWKTIAHLLLTPGSTCDNQKHGSTKIKTTLSTTMGKWGKSVSSKSGQEKIDFGKGKGERGKGKGERGKCGSRKSGKIERPPHKTAICSTENQMGNVGEMCQTRKGGEISTDTIRTIAIGIS